VPRANPQFIDPCTQIVPFSLGRVNVLSAVSRAGLSVVLNADALSPITTSPVLVTLNLVVPEEEAAIISPLFN
jgi:hypothetical protein